MTRLAAIIGVAWMMAELGLTQISRSPGSSAGNLQLSLNYIEMCADYMDVPCTYDNITMFMDPDREDILIVNGVLNIREVIPEGTYLHLDIRRCVTTDRKSCEKYIMHDVPDVCSILPMKNETWSKFTAGIQGFKPECPIPTGSYKMIEAEVDLGFLKNFTQLVGHWQLELSFISSVKRQGCLLYDLTMSYKRGGTLRH